MKALAINLYKMSGAGNTFTLVDARKNSPWVQLEKGLMKSRSELAAVICDKTLGFATDGLLFIQDGSDGADYSWDFFNSDGSTAEMCGNAARCAARFCADQFGLEIKRALVFRTGAGEIETKILPDGRVSVRMPKAHVINGHLELMTKSSSTEHFFFVNSGVPHLVQKIHDFHDVEALKDMAKEVRSHELLMPMGSNVTFYAPESENRILAVTFERGVEDYTLACGTGAVAAALAENAETGKDDIFVRMPGGVLEVSIKKNDDRPTMIGDVVYIGEFRMNPEVLIE